VLPSDDIHVRSNLDVVTDCDEAAVEDCEAVFNRGVLT
jgi:hypothetical protein